MVACRRINSGIFLPPLIAYAINKASTILQASNVDGGARMLRAHLKESAQGIVVLQVQGKI
jgi:hypothetical protein